MAATTTFFHTGPNHVEPSVRPPSSHGCAKLDGVAMWLVNGVANAFFASLQRCSCIRITTVDDHEDANDVPLISSDENLRRDVGCGGIWRKRSKGKKGVISGFVED
ncbi:hypothetical protein Hdeb2414_s0019g00539871 [Helianthus debilis subsp. tardiflorus]